MISSNESSHLEHPLVCDRIASALDIDSAGVNALHNRGRALEAAATSIAPFLCASRIERFIEENARCAINLEDLAGVAGVSMRALQLGFRRFRNTTPMAYLQRLDWSWHAANWPELGERAAPSPQSQMFAGSGT